MNSYFSRTDHLYKSSKKIRFPASNRLQKAVKPQQHAKEFLSIYKYVQTFFEVNRLS